MGTFADLIAELLEEKLNDPKFHDKLSREIEAIIRKVVRDEIDSIAILMRAKLDKLRPQMPEGP